MPLNAIMTPEPISLYRSRVFRALFYTRYTIYYIKKPFELEEMEKVILNVINRNSLKRNTLPSF